MSTTSLRRSNRILAKATSSNSMQPPSKKRKINRSMSKPKSLMQEQANIPTSKPISLLELSDDESESDDTASSIYNNYPLHHTRNSTQIQILNSSRSKPGEISIDLSNTSDDEDDDLEIIYDKKWTFKEPCYKQKNILLLKQNIDELTYGKELNQDLIDFALFYTYSKWDVLFRRSCYLLPGDFWRYLTGCNGKPGLGLENAKKCYSKIGHGIMKRKYIIFPKCSAHHWVLVIIANPNIHRSNHKYNEPCIIILDSTRKGATYYSDDCKKIREWLNFEMDTNVYNATTCKHMVPDMPQQKDGFDCGLFVWRNMIHFGKDEGFADITSEKKLNRMDWYSTDEGRKGRNELIKIIRGL